MRGALSQRRTSACVELRHLTPSTSNKGNTIVALIANPFGGFTHTVESLVRHLSKIQGVDGTTYGVHSSRSFYAHHAAAIEMACMRGDAETLLHGASCKETRRLSARHADGEETRRLSARHADGGLRCLGVLLLPEGSVSRACGFV